MGAYAPGSRHLHDPGTLAHAGPGPGHHPCGGGIEPDGKRAEPGGFMTPPRENHPVLSVQNLTIGIPSSRGFASVVGKIHLSVEAGSILGIAGESGSGKTLTACAIAGLLPAPLAIGRGRVLFAGRPAFHPGNGSPAFVRGKDVLLLFQSPGSALDPGVRAGIQIQDALTACLGYPCKPPGKRHSRQ